MWKTLQITYNYGVERGYVPHVPHFSLLLYCASTAMLFHAATWEPLTLRQNYWKFLHSLSGGRYVYDVPKFLSFAFLILSTFIKRAFSCIYRVAGMNREILEKFGLGTTRQLAEALRRTKTSNHIAFAL